MKTLNIDVTLLLTENRKLTQQANELLGNLDYASETVRVRQEQWDAHYNDFLAMEDTIPHSGRWNDSKRKAYMISAWGDLWAELQAGKETLIQTERQIKMVANEIAEFNRRLRIFEIIVTQEYNEGTLLKLGLDRVE